jgi:glutaredoxin
MEDNKKTITTLIVVAAIIVAIVIGFIARNNSSLAGTKIMTSLKKNQTFVIYLNNSNSSKCQKCASIKKILDDNKVDYYNYYKDKETNYSAMLKKLDIDENVIAPPAIIYVKDGNMYANIIAITGTTDKDITNFLKTYKLINTKKS